MEKAVNAHTIIREAAGEFALDAREICAVVGGFSGAGVWRVRDQSGGEFAIRKLQVTSTEETVRKTEICEWMALACSEEVAAVPQPIRCISQSSWQLQNSAGFWMAETWLPGFACRDTPGDSVLRNAACLVKSIHASGRRYAELANRAGQFLQCRRGPSPAVRRRLSLIRQLTRGSLAQLQGRLVHEPDPRIRAEAEVLLRHLPTVLEDTAKTLQQLANQHWELQPVLRDLWYPHVLLQGDAVTGIVDWQAAAVDHCVVDAARLLRSWCGPDALKFADAVKVFSSEWGLGAGETRLLTAIDRASVMLSPLTWLQGRYRGLRLQDPHAVASERLYDLLVTAVACCRDIC
jgi:hypothetical protein